MKGEGGRIISKYVYQNGVLVAVYSAQIILESESKITCKGDESLLPFELGCSVNNNNIDV